MTVSVISLDFQKKANKLLEKRGVLKWEWELDPTENHHEPYPIFEEDGEKLFLEKEELFKQLNCFFCRARYGPCKAVKCFFKTEGSP